MVVLCLCVLLPLFLEYVRGYFSVARLKRSDWIQNEEAQKHSIPLFYRYSYFAGIAYGLPTVITNHVSGIVSYFIGLTRPAEQATASRFTSILGSVYNASCMHDQRAASVVLTSRVSQI
ncbi:hypothetical protein BC826DRAFT_172644 [Russula brevipes]|nr:hypothetical protein BC826DRAFT_172644 [Russula brevipes]